MLVWTQDSSCHNVFVFFSVQCDTDVNNTSRPILPWRGTLYSFYTDGIIVIITTVYILITNISLWIIITPFQCTLSYVLSLWKVQSSDKSDGKICLFLLVRWSRCSLPSPQMWPGTWTTRTWFTSLLTERKRTRSETFCHRKSVFCLYMTWNWPTALEGDMDYGVCRHLC